MGRLLPLGREILGNVLAAAVGVVLLAGLAPWLWEHNGWAGVGHRVRGFVPAALVYAVTAPAGRLTREWLRRRRAR